MGNIKTDAILDTKGLNCPVPVLKTKKALDNLSPGQVLGVYATDPITKQDIPALVKRLGHELIQINEEDNGVLEFFIKK